MAALQGHAIKNQDLLVASGALTLKGSEGMSDVDEDMRIASQNQSSSLTTHQLQEQVQEQEDIDATLLALSPDKEALDAAAALQPKKYLVYLQKVREPQHRQ